MHAWHSIEYEYQSDFKDTQFCKRLSQIWHFLPCMDYLMSWHWKTRTNCKKMKIIKADFHLRLKKCSSPWHFFSIFSKVKEFRFWRDKAQKSTPSKCCLRSKSSNLIKLFYEVNWFSFWKLFIDGHSKKDDVTHWAIRSPISRFHQPHKSPRKWSGQELECKNWVILRQSMLYYTIVIYCGMIKSD